MWRWPIPVAEATGSPEIQHQKKMLIIISALTTEDIHLQPISPAPRSPQKNDSICMIPTRNIPRSPPADSAQRKCLRCFPSEC
jgi:hypothetical protein